MSNLPVIKQSLGNDVIKKRFSEILGSKAPGFISSIINVVNNNNYLQKADANSVIMAAAVAATLDLPIDPNLGFSAIVPYGAKAQFQIMYKGLIQLAMRSGQYKTIGATPIFKGQLISENPLTSGYVFDFTVKPEGAAIGYAAYFKLINGFEKVVYWPIDKIDKHGKRFSQTYKQGKGLWQDDFQSMAIKTVLKNLLSKWGILSIEMQTAVKYDQSVIKDIDSDDFEYTDNKEDQFENDEAVKARIIEDFEKEEKEKQTELKLGTDAK